MDNICIVYYNLGKRNIAFKSDTYLVDDNL